jgi:DNA-binding NarL/FixJ family response regulator
MDWAQDNSVQNGKHQPITVFALVTQPLVAEGLARALEPCRDLDFLGFCADHCEVTGEVLRLRPGLLLLDQAFGLRAVVDLLLSVRRAGSDVRTVLWTRQLSGADQRLVLEAGTCGILERTQPVSVLLECFRKVAAGHIWTGQSAANPGQDQRVAQRLTQREREVVSLVRTGLRNRDIAQSMSITAGTVKVHLMHIFEKTGARDRHELGLMAARLLEHAAEPGPQRRSS